MRSSASSPETFHAALVDELRTISTGLVYEPVGTGGSEAAPLEHELNVIETVLRAHRRARPLGQFPMVHVASLARPSRERALLSALQHRAGDLSRGRRGVARQTTSGLDEPSARAMLARVVAIDRDARAAIRRIERNRRFRDTPMPSGSTLYESVDEPVLARLRDLQHRSRRAAVALRRGLSEGSYAAVQPAAAGWEGSGRGTGTPGQARSSGPDRAFLGPKSEGVVRPLSALYERWVMVRVVEALRAAGLLGGSIHDALIRDERKGDWRDFDDEAAVTLHAKDNRLVRVRFEPWIHSRNIAVMRGEGLYRAGDAPHSWRPDIVIQVEDGARAGRQAWSSGVPSVRAVIIIDAKLAPVLRMMHWQQVQKYRYVRAAANDARIVRHVFIASPGGVTALPPDAASGADSPEVLTLSPEPAGHADTAASLERLAASVLDLL